MSMQVNYADRPVAAGLVIVVLGVLVGVACVASLTLVRPVLIAFALGGLLILLPTLVIREQKAYWLFLLVLSIPFEIAKRTTTWLVDPIYLRREFAMPATGTISIDLYMTDVVLLAMILPWLARIFLRRETFYFPKVGYIYVLYLIWSLISSLIEAQSFYLSIFEWCRQILYFVSFIYIVNNVITRSQFRAIVLGLFVGMSIAAGTVIAFFDLNIGTEKSAFSELYSDQGDNTISDRGTLYGGYGERNVKRSAGMFSHPSYAGYYLEYILPIVLAYLIAARRNRNRLLFAALFGFGLLAMYFTFARAPVVGLFCGCVLVVGIAGWSGLISRRAFARSVFTFAVFVALISPLVIKYMNTRLDAVTRREELIEMAVQTIWKRPIIGAGLNNSSVVSPARSIDSTGHGTRELNVTVVHNHYLIVLVEVGIVGFVLFFSFFGRTVMIAFRHVRAAEMEKKLLLVGMIGGLVSVAVHNLADPFGTHMVWAMLWLYAALMVTISRQIDLAAAPRRSPMRLQPELTLGRSAGQVRPLGA